MVPRAEFRSYYGRPVVKDTVWGPDIPSYLFFGGLAGASSALAAGAQLSGHPELARAPKAGAAGAISLSMVALVHDLGRPTVPQHAAGVQGDLADERRHLAAVRIHSLAVAAAGCAVTGKMPRAGPAATAGAAALGPAVAAYTAVLLADTATPAWHDAYRELPYVFVGSAATAAGGLGLLAVAPEHATPAARLAIVGAAAELTAERLLHQRLGPVARPYRPGGPGH